MRILLHKLLILMFPLAVLVILVYCIDLPRYYAYYYTKNDGCNITWIYDRIFDNQKDVDLVFLGTSHTGCGINDGLLDSLLPMYKVVNLSYCQGGRNIQYTVLKDIIKNHQPKKVFLEVRMEEDFTSHRDFGTLGYPEDVLGAPMLINSNYIKDVYKAFLARYMYFQDGVMDVLPEIPHYRNHLDYSHIQVFNRVESIEILKSHRQREEEKNEKFVRTKIRDHRLKFPKYYLQKIISVCRENNIELVFLYIPSYGMAREEPYEADFYRSTSELLIPPSTLFRDGSLWMDTEHFNGAGARAFSKWLYGQINSNE